jgi:hypothetical protein
MVATWPWLESHGVYRQLAAVYVKGHWLDRMGIGAFKRSGDRVKWSGGMSAIQTQLNLPVHVAGKSALELWGFGHFATAEETRTIHFLGEPSTSLPKWFLAHDWGVKVQFSHANLFSGEQDLGLTVLEVSACPVTIATPERAALELLHGVPDKQDFSEAGLIMEGLATLRTDVLQELLEQCRSIKVKRLALLLAERYRLPWVSRLEPRRIELGSGKRQLVPGGRLDRKYQLTVPTEFLESR